MASRYVPKSTQLTVADLVKVQKEAWTAREKWYDIGLQLGLLSDVLNNITSCSNQGPDVYFRLMLEKWLRDGHLERTWQKLISSLESDQVDFGALAQSILAKVESITACAEQCSVHDCHSHDIPPIAGAALTADGEHLAEIGFKCPHCGNCSIQEFFDNKCPPVSDCFPYLDTKHLNDSERNELYLQLFQETKNIVGEFSMLVQEVIKSFSNRVKLDDVITTILSIAPGDSLTLPLLSAMSPLRTAETFSGIINILLENRYLSFVNYYIIEHLIKQHGTGKQMEKSTESSDVVSQNQISASQVRKTDHELLQMYLTKFHHFCQRSVFEVPQHVFGPIRISHDGEKLAFKVTKNFTESIRPANATSAEDAVASSVLEVSANTLNMSLEDTIVLQGRIAESLGLKRENKWSLIFLGAFRGCIELNFLVPQALVDQLKTSVPLGVSEPSKVCPNAGIINLAESGIHLLCGPPGEPEVSEKSTNTIKVCWTPPEYCGLHSPKYYRVSYRSLTDPPGKWKTKDTKGPSNSLIIENLSQKEEIFSFKVRAVTEIGIGIQSKVNNTDLIMFTTLCEPELGPLVETYTDDSDKVSSNKCTVYIIV